MAPSAVLILSICTLTAAAALPQAGRWAYAAAGGGAPPDAGAGGGDGPDREQDEGLRQRLTEREDKRRPPEPWSARVAGRPLVVSGEWEIGLGHLRRRVLGEAVREPDRSLLEQGLEVELFYSWGPVLSLFAQLTGVMEEDLRAHTVDEVSDVYVERGEMWLYSENVAGSHVNFEIGRLDFDDERRWWWDEELDAVRLEYERETFSLALALAYEIAPGRSDRSYVKPEQERVLRLLGEASWDWRSDHTLELFLLHHRDRSATERIGEVLQVDREDESDARLTWSGVRLMGVNGLGSAGLVGYWLDAAVVHGRETLLEFVEVARRRSQVQARERRDVGGWGVDAGLSWLLPVAGWEPRLWAGYAYGSGDATPEGSGDRAFRQSGIQTNEAGFGGVERFAHYGLVLDPELSNLRVATLGAGISLLASSSLDLVYHHYRLVEPAESLRDSRLEHTLDGRRRTLGHGLDLVLAVEEWERLELELIAAAFRGGPAFGPEEGKWAYGGSFAVRIAF